MSGKGFHLKNLSKLKIMQSAFVVNTYKEREKEFLKEYHRRM